MADNKYLIEYAARGTAACKKCKEKIGKGEIRIAKLTANPFNDDPDAVLKNWHHVPCIFDIFSRARATTKTIEDVDDLPGWDTIKPEDRPDIMKLINENADRFTKARAGQKEKTPKKKNTPAAPKTTPTAPKPTTTKPAMKQATASPMAGPSSAKSSDGGGTSGGGVSDKDAYIGTTDKSHKDNSFRAFRVLVANVADTAGYIDKTNLIRTYITKGNDGESFKGDVYLTMALLLPGN